MGMSPTHPAQLALVLDSSTDDLGDFFGADDGFNEYDFAEDRTTPRPSGRDYEDDEDATQLYQDARDQQPTVGYADYTQASKHTRGPHHATEDAPPPPRFRRWRTDEERANTPASQYQPSSRSRAYHDSEEDTPPQRHSRRRARVEEEDDEDPPRQQHPRRGARVDDEDEVEVDAPPRKRTRRVELEEQSDEDDQPTPQRNGTRRDRGVHHSRRSRARNIRQLSPHASDVHETTSSDSPVVRQRQPPSRRRRRLVKTVLRESDNPTLNALLEHEDEWDITTQLTFTDAGKFGGFKLQHGTLQECLSVAANYCLAIVVYTQKTPFPDKTPDNREVEGAEIGGIALGMAASMAPPFVHIKARVEAKDTFFISTLGRAIWDYRYVFRPKAIVIARREVAVAYGLDKLTGARRIAAIHALLQNNNFIYKGVLENASRDPNDTRMVYKISARARKAPYSADPYPVIIAQTFMGGAEKESEGWNFPDKFFPLATQLPQDHQGPRPREIPVQMVAYVTMAIQFALQDLQNAKPSRFEDERMRGSYNAHYAAHFTYKPETSRALALQYLYQAAKNWCPPDVLSVDEIGEANPDEVADIYADIAAGRLV